MTHPFRFLTDPDPAQLGDDPEAFLRALSGPTFIELRGERRGTPRAAVTLLHGNEPSGVHAVHRFVRGGERPATDLLLCVVNVEAALLPPLFSHRHVPARPDLNRRFAAPFAGRDGELCQALLGELYARGCESLIDIHNTSGHGPAYAVCTRVGDAQRALASLFVSRVVHTELRLNTLMEATADRFPTITVECGGARQVTSHEVAFSGLCRYAHTPVIAGEYQPLTVRAHPVRVELVDDARVAFADEPALGADLTLRRDIERHNFEPMRAGQSLGYVGPRGLSVLRAVRGETPVEIDALFIVRDGQLVAADDLEPLMVTTDPEIAREDCLFYVVTLG